MPQIYSVTGRLARDPELRTSKKGTAICKLSIPTDDGWGDNKKTTWHSIVCFGKTAEIIAAHKKKGDWVQATGRLEIDEWEDKNGTKRSTPQLIANSVDFVGNKAQGYVADDSYGTQPGEPDNIPF